MATAAFPRNFWRADDFQHRPNPAWQWSFARAARLDSHDWRRKFRRSNVVIESLFAAAAASAVPTATTSTATTMACQSSADLFAHACFPHRHAVAVFRVAARTWGGGSRFGGQCPVAVSRVRGRFLWKYPPVLGDIFGLLKWRRFPIVTGRGH